MPANPTTPPSSSAQVEEVSQRTTSTPNSRGAAANNSYDTQSKRLDYDPYLLADLEKARAITFDQLLDVVYDSRDWREDAALKAIVEKEKFNELLEHYCRLVGKETDRYKLFNDLANYILEELPDEDPKIVFCRNDHMTVKGSHANRSPDSAIIDAVRLRLGKRYGVDDMSKRGPHGEPFHWLELLQILEFKIIDKIINMKAIRKAKHEAERANQDAQSTSAPTGQDLSSEQASASSSLSHPSAAVSSSSSRRSGSKRPTKVSVGSTGDRKTRSKSRAEQPSTSSSVAVSSSNTSLKRALLDPENPNNKKPRLENQDALIQCASYSLEMLSNGGLRFYALGSLITDDKLQLLYYDHSVVVQSEPISFVADPLCLVGWISCLKKLGSDPSQWGQVPQITYPEPIKIPEISTKKGTLLNLNLFKNATISLNNNVVLVLGELIFQQHALIGRGTCVINAHVKEAPDIFEDWKNKELVVKFSFTPDTRTSEGIILKEIYSIANSKDNQWPGVKRHLPEVLHYEALPASGVQARLKIHFPNDYEERTLQVMVMTKLSPVRDLTESKTLAPVIRDVFNCYKWLYEKADVIHRDISVNNIMYRVENDTIYGVLTDFDLSLSRRLVKTGTTSNQRTGTTPYMAIDLLVNPRSAPPEHLYRHDLESLFYVIVDLTISYEDGVEGPKKWHGRGVEQLARDKRAFINTDLPKLTPKFQEMAFLAENVRRLFMYGYMQRSEYEVRKSFINSTLPKFTPKFRAERDYVDSKEDIGESSETADGFDYSTLGGIVDFEQYEKILFNPSDPTLKL